MSAAPRLIKIAVLAMGGEGGGVLADWLVDLAEHAGHVAQTTSVPGVAQRTGATIYYVELLVDGGRQAQPVMALMPLPGDVDIVLASELMEAARAVQRGLVTPDRTTMVASTHRVYAIAEKTAMGDGRADSAALLASARGATARFVGFDMAQAAEDAGSVISAVLFGALAGTGALPFTRDQFEATIQRGGVGVNPSLKAFGAAFERAARGDGQAPSGHVLSESVELIRVVTAAELLGVSRDTLDRLIRSLPDHLKPEIQPTKGVGRRKTYFWRNRAHLLRWHEEALASKRPSVPVAPPHSSNRPAAKVIEGEAVTDWRAVANQVGRAKKG